MRKGIGFKERASKVINRSDIVLEILDARFPAQTRNIALENIVKAKGKQLVFVLNKSDLVSKRKAEAEKKKLASQAPTVFLSLKAKQGLKRLREVIGRLAGNKQVVIGIIGYPNTGKSSLTNALKGRKVAPVSIKAGFTRGEKFIRVSDKIVLIDTPGVIPVDERDEFKLILSVSKNPEQISEPELAALKLVELFQKEGPGRLEKFYSLGREKMTAEAALEKIAVKKKRLLKGREPDIKATAKQVLWDYQKGKLKLK